MRRMGRAAGAIALALAAARASSAFADVNGQITATNNYDDNIFRAPDRAILPGYSRSDDLNTLGAGGTISLTKEHFQLKVSGDVSQNWYDRNSFLNSLSYDGTLELSERQKYIDIDVQAIQSQGLSSFSDIHTPIKNLQSLTRTAARFGLAVTSDVRLVFDGKFNRDTNSNIEISPADYNQSVAGIGVGYFSPSGNSVVLEELRAYTQGGSQQIYEIDDLPVDSKVNYIDDTTLVQLAYSPSAVTSLLAQGGYLRRTDQSIFHDNINTPVGLLRFSYHPDSVAAVNVSAGRQLGSQSYLLISGLTDEYIEISPSATFVNGLKVAIDVSYDHRNYGVVPQFEGVLSNTSTDTMRYDATLSYQLFDNYQFAIAAYHENRRSNMLDEVYNDNGVMFTFTIRSARPLPPKDSVDSSDLLLLP